MAFKKMTEYNEEKFGNFFRLVNDKDCADVVFLYRSTADVLVAEAHYIKTPDYSGYVQCLDRGCPACTDGIRKQEKLFIPVLVIAHSDPDFKGPKVQFWDRSMRFQPQLLNDVFRMYPVPCEMVFRVTRHGAAGSVDTSYSIQALRHVPEEFGPYEQMLSYNGVIFPDSYEMVCKDYNAFELRSMLSAPKDGTSSTSSTNSYGAVPRGSYGAASAQTVQAAATPAVADNLDEDPVYVAPALATVPEDNAVLEAADSLEVDEISDDVNF